jgi:nitrile hydratase subunit alpha
MLLLSLAGPRSATGLVKVRALSLAVSDPRGVLRGFGVELAEDLKVRVWNSTAKLRYLVLPERPVGGEKFSADALAALVTRDAMIGVAKVTLPQTGVTDERYS